MSLLASLDSLAMFLDSHFNRGNWALSKENVVFAATSWALFSNTSVDVTGEKLFSAALSCAP